ncbi:AAA family ATPase [Nocardia sp. NPDC088792]|uniref:helix-turn-helix transcriptional regulator n=1 Tax=Nocardia sp. NPDC088792 TaxID=3364332 RepID=UPI00382CA940
MNVTRWRFVGRAEQLRVFSRAWQDSSTHGVVRCVVSGEPGIGRTALLEAMASECARRGSEVISLSWDSDNRSECGALVDDLIEALADRLPADSPDGAALVDGWQREKTAPEETSLSERTVSAEFPLLLTAVRNAVSQLCHDAPLVLTVDDANHASARSLDMLRRFIDACARLSVVVVLAVRSGEPARAPAEFAGLSVDAHRCALEGLTEAETGVVLRDRLRHGVGAAVISACHRLTTGNPFLVAELARRLGEADEFPAPVAMNALVVPSVVDQFVERAIRVDPRAGQLVEAIAVASRFATTGAALVAHLSDLGLVDTLQTLDLLARMGIVSDSDELALRHPLLANAILARMTLMARNAAHLRIADYLYAHDAPVESVARHLSASTVAQPGSWPAEVLLRAADVARESDLDDTAGRYLELAAVAEAGVAQRRAVLELADLRLRTDPVSGLAAVVAMLARTTDPVVRRRLLGDIGRTLCHPAVSSDRRRLRNATAAALAGTEFHGWGQLHHALSRLARMSPAQAAEFAENLPADLPLNSAALLGPTSAFAAFFRHLVDDDPTEALRTARAALERQPDELDTQPLALAAALTVLVDTGHPEEAAIYLRRLDDESGHGAADGNRADIAYLDARIAFTRGDLPTARRLLTDHIGDEDRTGADTPLATEMIGLLAHVLLSTGDNAAAEALLRRHRYGEELPFDWHYGDVLLARARLRAAGGDFAGTVRDLAELRLRGQENGLRTAGTACWRMYGVALLDQVGQHERANRLALQQVRFAERTGSALEQGRALRALGRVSPLPQRERMLREAIALLESAPGGLDIIHATADLGSVLIQQQRQDEAVVALTTAMRHAEQCAAGALGEQARQQLLAMDERATQHVSLRGVLSLTAREREILIDAMRGQTNRRISTIRKITSRTVELHLSSAYRKLGISGREGFPLVFSNPGLWTLLSDGTPVADRRIQVGDSWSSRNDSVFR